jgi:hypothetical protein
VGESVIECHLHRSCSKIHTRTIIAVIEHVQVNISTFKMADSPRARPGRHRRVAPAGLLAAARLRVDRPGHAAWNPARYAMRLSLFFCMIQGTKELCF